MQLFNSKALLLQWKPRDATENFDTYRNLQPHRAVLPAIEWHLVYVRSSFEFDCVFIIFFFLCVPCVRSLWKIKKNYGLRRSATGGAENLIDGPMYRAWNCRTWKCRTWKSRIWNWVRSGERLRLNRLSSFRLLALLLCSLLRFEKCQRLK